MPRVPQTDFGNSAPPSARPALISEPRVGGPSAGDGFKKIGAVLAQASLDADRTAVQGADTDRDSWTNTRLYDPNDGAFTRKGEDALGQSDVVLGEFDNHVRDSMKGLRGERAQRAYLESSMASRRNLESALGRYEIGQRNEYEDATASARVSTATETGALNYNDAPTLGKARGDIESTVAAQGDRRGWSDEQRTDASRKALGGLHNAVIDRMLADKRVGMAKKYLGQNKGELSSQDQLQIQRSIDAAEREGRNELEAGMRVRVADSSAALQRGLPAPNMPSAAELEFVFPGQGKTIHASLLADQRMGADLKAINTMSPAEVEAKRAEYTVTQGGAGVRDSLSRQDEFNRAVSVSAQQRQSNPAQFAIDNGLGYRPLPQDPAGAANELRNREAVQAQASSKVGARVPLLTPAEAKQIGGELNEASDATAVETFDYFRATLGDKAYAELMQQVAPDSPVKAYAGQIYGRKPPVILRERTFSPDEQVQQRIVAQTMVVGENIINKTKEQKGADGKPVKSLLVPSKVAFDSAFSDSVGTAFAGNPQALEMAQQAAYAYYTGKSAQTGRTNKEGEPIDDDLMSEAMRATVGQVVDFHGYGDVLPPLGVDEDQFEEGVRARFVAEMKSRGIERQAALEAYPSLGVVNVGGKYMLTRGRDPFSVKGKAVIIDLNAPFVEEELPPLTEQFTPL